ncbi:AEC family transporter [Blautia sp. MSJ-9]|uniref:AEC family transporter n=1 Tax=Blautia sp. MSJ-9 TaxID=2841511 RepID=UPI003FA40820
MGFLIVKTGLLKDDDSKVLSKIVLYLIIPCVIINAFQVDYTMDTVKGLLIALAASVMIQIILLIILSVLGKLLHLNEVEIASVYYSNSGNLIVPIVTFILGQEWVLYGCVFMSVQLVFLWTHCKKIISREPSYDWKNFLTLLCQFIQIHIAIFLINFPFWIISKRTHT